MFFDIPRRSEFMERTFGHPREDIDHRIDPILLIPIREGHDFNAVSEKGPVEKPVQKEHLT